MSDTFFATVTCFSIIVAALMAGLACRLNEIWANHYEKFADLLDEQNKFLMKLNREWYDAYMKMVDMKAKVAENERD